jgi:hypothetical protein
MLNLLKFKSLLVVSTVSLIKFLYYEQKTARRPAAESKVIQILISTASPHFLFLRTNHLLFLFLRDIVHEADGAPSE